MGSHLRIHSTFTQWPPSPPTPSLRIYSDLNSLPPPSHQRPKRFQIDSEDSLWRRGFCEFAFTNETRVMWWDERARSRALIQSMTSFTASGRVFLVSTFERENARVPIMGYHRQPSTPSNVSSVFLPRNILWPNGIVYLRLFWEIKWELSSLKWKMHRRVERCGSLRSNMAVAGDCSTSDSKFVGCLLGLVKKIGRINQSQSLRMKVSIGLLTLTSQRREVESGIERKSKSKLHECSSTRRHNEVHAFLFRGHIMSPRLLAFTTCTNPIMHLFNPPKICIGIVFDFP